MTGQHQVVKEDVKLGKNVQLWHFVNIYGCEIGDNTNIGSFVEIRKSAKVGANCKIQAFVFIPEGVTIEDNVFIGPHTSFTNDKFPRATNPDGSMQTEHDWEVVPTIVKKGASIGANCTIMCGLTIGENSMVAAGSTVTKDVPANTVVVGSPAKVVKELE